MAESQALPTVISASWKYVWKKSNAVIQVKHIMSIEMFAILERHICKDIIQFRNIYYKKKTVALKLFTQRKRRFNNYVI